MDGGRSVGAGFRGPCGPNGSARPKEANQCARFPETTATLKASETAVSTLGLVLAEKPSIMWTG